MPTPATRGAATAFRSASRSGIWGSEGGFRPIADVADALSPSGERYAGLAACCLAAVERGWTTSPSDRKSVVSGKSVSVRVDIGGCRIIKKNKRNTACTKTIIEMNRNNKKYH